MGAGVQTCAQAGFLSKLFFWWLNDLLLLGYHHKLQSSDLDDQLLSSDSASKLSEEAFRRWDAQVAQYRARRAHLLKHDLANLEGGNDKNPKKIKSPSLFAVIRAQFGVRYTLLGLLPFIEECGLRIVQPMLIGTLMEKLTRADADENGPPYLEAFLIILCSILSVFTTHWFYFSVQHIGMRVRVVCSSLIYRKCLHQVRDQVQQGKLLTLLSTDVQRVDQSCVSLHYLWIAPCNLAIVFTILYVEYGWSCLIGLAVLLGFTVLQALLGVQFSKFRSRTAKETDQRLEFLSSMLKKMKQIKMLGLEKMYEETCRRLRTAEMAMIRRTAHLRMVNLTLFYSSIKIVFFVIIWWVGVRAGGGAVNPARVFVTLALFNNIRNLITSYLPNGILQLAEARVAMRRIEKYLNSPEPPDSFHGAPGGRGGLLPAPHFPFYGLQHAELDHLLSSSYAHTQETCKELEAQQQPFVRFTNVGLRYREDPLNLEITSGDVVNIVGGVGTGKTSLLKAILQEFNLPSTGRIEFHGKLAYCPQSAWIYPAPMRDNIILNHEYQPEKYERILRACALTHLGQVSMESLSGGMRARIALARAAYADADIFLLDDPFAALDKSTKTHIVKELIGKVLRGKIVIICGGDGSLGRMVSLDGVAVVRRRSLATGSLEDPSAQAGKSENEDQEPVEPLHEVGRAGGVGWGTLYKYFKSGCGAWGLATLVVANLACQASFTGTDYYLRVWTSESDQAASSQSMMIFGTLTASVVVASVLRTFLFFRVCLRASMRIHEKILEKVITSKLEFFLSHGKILNRFSKDMALMDESLPTTFFSAAGVLLQVVGTVILISILQPFSLIPALILSLVFYALRRFYIRTGCAIRRFEALALSPLYTLVSSTSSAAGLSTIRCFGAESRFLEEFLARLDAHSASWYVNLAASRWFGIWLDWISVLYTAIVVGSFVVGHQLGADAGLAITSVLFLAGTFQLGARQSADAENQLVAVERIFEYENLDVEDFSSGRDDVDVDAPIVFQNVKVIYEDNNHVLSDINFVIGRGEKVALLGRTGCGKTTLLKALYRLCDYTGQISFNGIDAQDIKLRHLRSSVSIIPQEPYLFRGTVRENLDPTGVMSDDEIARVFNRFSSYFEGGIHFAVEEDGHNLSQGQKQILSLVRVMLKGNKILVLDEPTANLDSTMDELIKQSLSEFCSNCTVITVAHRLQTVEHYDRAYTLKNGMLKETPLSRTTR